MEGNAFRCECADDDCRRQAQRTSVPPRPARPARNERGPVAPIECRWDHNWRSTGSQAAAVINRRFVRESRLCSTSMHSRTDLGCDDYRDPGSRVVNRRCASEIFRSRHLHNPSLTINGSFRTSAVRIHPLSRHAAVVGGASMIAVRTRPPGSSPAPEVGITAAITSAPDGAGSRTDFLRGLAIKFSAIIRTLLGHDGQSPSGRVAAGWSPHGHAVMGPEDVGPRTASGCSLSIGRVRSLAVPIRNPLAAPAGRHEPVSSSATGSGVRPDPPRAARHRGRSERM